MIPEDQLTQFKLLEQLKQIESHPDIIIKWNLIKKVILKKTYLIKS